MIGAKRYDNNQIQWIRSKKLLSYNFTNEKSTSEEYFGIKRDDAKLYIINVNVDRFGVLCEC